MASTAEAISMPPAWATERGRSIRPPAKIVADRTALVVIDMQNFFLDPSVPIAVPNGAALVARINRLVGIMRTAGVPVIWVQHGYPPSQEPVADPRHDKGAAFRAALAIGKPGYELAPELDALPGDLRVSKQTVSALHPRSECDLGRILREQETETIVIAGIETNVCCETTARDAHQHDFSVIIAADGTGAMTTSEHDAALLNLSLWFAEVHTIDEIERLARPD
ncbi:cysteine hydrolase family protein [Sphingopyxis sp.]|uniref:cysteine hydrolase family protein n=1 Tax=Sphingopyxis sp. TaxID=1908224 RepID=UPI003D6D78B0